MRVRTLVSFRERNKTRNPLRNLVHEMAQWNARIWFALFTREKRKIMRWNIGNY